MSPLGALLGAAVGCGLVLVLARVRAIVRPSMRSRVAPWIPEIGAVDAGPSALVPRVAGILDDLLGGSASVRRRLERAGLDRTVHEFRIDQVVWGVLALGVATVWALLRTLAAPSALVPSLLVCAAAFCGGVLARDQWLTSQVRTRERRMLAEFPTIAELLALAVSAGESPVVALERVVRRTGGEFTVELGRVLADARTGVPVAQAFDALAARTGLPVVARFSAGLAVALERGTPLADVLHAQAGDVREAGRRELIEIAARKEVLMMIPVVFLVLPVTVLFAFWPGLLGLQVIAG